MVATCVSSAQASRNVASPAAAPQVPLPRIRMGDVSLQWASGRAGRGLECPGCGCCSSQPLARGAEGSISKVLLLLLKCPGSPGLAAVPAWAEPVLPVLV